MKLEEVIEQLDSIKSHCEDFVDKEEPGSIWHKDEAALSIAIKILKRTSQPGS